MLPAVAAAARAGLFNRLLLPVDASDNAAHAVEYAIALRRITRRPKPWTST